MSSGDESFGEIDHMDFAIDEAGGGHVDRHGMERIAKPSAHVSFPIVTHFPDTIYNNAANPEVLGALARAEERAKTKAAQNNNNNNNNNNNTK
jgi:hypothetical protein